MGYTNLKYLNKSVLQSFLSNYDKFTILGHTYAMEREMLRVVDFKNSTYKHPEVFGYKSRNMYITTDFAENQVEVITDQHKTIGEVIDFNEALFDIVASELKEDEVLWPLSMPCEITDDISESTFREEKENELYRKYLTNKYGKNKQMISGIHFNFSFAEEFISDLYKYVDYEGDYQAFKDSVYLKVINNYLYYQYLITVFLSATPIANDSFGVTNDVYSIRNSKYGYRNLEDLGIDYSSIDSFITSVKSAIDQKLIIDEREIYESIRIKNGHKYVSEHLKETGIKYIEIRNIDINPYFKGGANPQDLQFLELVLMFCLYTDFEEKPRIDELISSSTDISEYEDIILSDLAAIRDFCCKYRLDLCNLVDEYVEQIKTNNTLTMRVKREILEIGFESFGYKYANKYLTSAYENRYKFLGFESLELSTQLLIKEAVKRGIKVDILDKSDNFIKLSTKEKSELIMQATKTSVDGYVNILAMENKVVTKKILDEAGIKTPKGREFTNIHLAYKYALSLKDNFVIKPKSTNFGIGVNIFKDVVIEEDVLSAVEFAFKHDNTIIVEEFIKGKEYRFLVIGDSTVGVLHRVPANVVGDDKHSIAELVEIKNKDSLRGSGYVSPLEKIKIDEVCKTFLHAQGMDENTVLDEGVQVFLRENSNVSTGGDSIDYTDTIPTKYKELAAEATKLFDVAFCGVDIIIEDIDKEDSDYGIIELNFNPAIHIHSYPYQGKERNIAKEILAVLKLV